MGRPRKSGVRYLEHKQSGRARAVWTDPSGKYHDLLLPGPFNSTESVAAFGRLLLNQELKLKSPAIPVEERAHLTLAGLLDAYREYARRRYRRPDGTATSELAEVKVVVKVLSERFGHEPAKEFGAAQLVAVRQAWEVAGLARKEINRRVNIVKRVFKWALAEALVPVNPYLDLLAVEELQPGQTTARESESIKPVSDEMVNATLPFLNRHIRAMVEFQRRTGARPGEVCALRMCDIDRTGEVWRFRPGHKLPRKVRARILEIGPSAQEVLKPFITDDPQAYLFSAAAAVAEVRAERTAARQTPRFESHLTRNATKRKPNPKRAPTGRYNTHAYSVAVARACDRAFPLPAELASRPKEPKAKWWARLTKDEQERVRKWRQAHRWHPNQFRLASIARLDPKADRGATDV